jgi:hypothetical protein
MTEEEKKALEEKERLEAERKKKEQEDKTYSEAYVKGIRDEAAKYRTKLRDVEERLSKFDGIDPAELLKLKEEKELAEKRKLEEQGKWEELKTNMVKAHQDELAKKDEAIKQAQVKYEALEAQYNDAILTNAIAVEASMAKALNPSVLKLVVAQEAKVEVLENGQRVIKLYKPDGQVKLDMKTGEPLSIKQRLEEMKQDSEYAMLFEGATGGAGSNTSQGTQKNVNPWKKETFNLTKQGQIYRENPELAKRLAAEAGATIGYGA